MKIVVVAGARPNFMKVAPLIEALQAVRRSNPRVEVMLIHTGQHYDADMSGAFFQDLGLPYPDFSLGIGSGTHAEQTGKVMIAFERLMVEQQPNWVIVVGDVNSTLACALAAKKLGVRVAHVEAGLRARDLTMPEEINRVVTDVICDALFTTEPKACDNLRAEGIAAEKIHFVGNVMIDTLLKYRERATSLAHWQRLGLEARRYGMLTLHRPSNVDATPALAGIVEALEEIAHDLAIVFPVHPRTRKSTQELNFWADLERIDGLHLLPPLGYLEMLSLNSAAAVILTDSGGLQEEALVLGVPCVTLRDNTERPITVDIGANVLVGSRPKAIVTAVRSALKAGRHEHPLPAKWDGHAAQRIVGCLLDS